MEPKIYTVKQLAKILGVSVVTVRNEIDRGKLPCFRVGNEARFTQHHVDAYMNIKEFGKTQREMDLEKEKEELLEVIKGKNKLIDNIKNLILQR